MVAGIFVVLLFGGWGVSFHCVAVWDFCLLRFSVLIGGGCSDSCSYNVVRGQWRGDAHCFSVLVCVSREGFPPLSFPS